MATTGYKFRALILDDDNVSRHMLTQCLRLYGFQVYETAQYEKAIRSFISLKPGIIFLDQNIKPLSGLEVAYFIRRLTGGRYTNIYLHTTQAKSDLITNKNYQYIDEYLKKGDTLKLMSIIKQYRMASQLVTG